MENGFSKQESLDTIQRMVANAQRRFQEKGEITILWGWLVMLTSLAHYLILKFQWISGKYAWLVWMVMLVVGFVLQYRIIRKKSRERQYTTYYDRTMAFLWSGVMLVYLFILYLSFSGQINWQTAYALFFMIFGAATYITGGIIKSTPFIAGGLMGIPLGIIALSVPGEYLLLLMAAAMIVFNLIPGYWLKMKNSKQS